MSNTTKKNTKYFLNGESHSRHNILGLLNKIEHTSHLKVETNKKDDHEEIHYSIREGGKKDKKDITVSDAIWNLSTDSEKKDLKILTGDGANISDAFTFSNVKAAWEEFASQMSVRLGDEWEKEFTALFEHDEFSKLNVDILDKMAAEVSENEIQREYRQAHNTDNDLDERNEHKKNYRSKILTSLKSVSRSFPYSSENPSYLNKVNEKYSKEKFFFKNLAEDSYLVQGTDDAFRLRSFSNDDIEHKKENYNGSILIEGQTPDMKHTFIKKTKSGKLSKSEKGMETFYSFKKEPSVLYPSDEDKEKKREESRIAKERLETKAKQAAKKGVFVTGGGHGGAPLSKEEEKERNERKKAAARARREAIYEEVKNLISRAEYDALLKAEKKDAKQVSLTRLTNFITSSGKKAELDKVLRGENDDDSE